MDENLPHTTSRCIGPTIDHPGSLIVPGVGVCFARDRSSLLSPALSGEVVHPLVGPEVEVPERFV